MSILSMETNSILHGTLNKTVWNHISLWNFPAEIQYVPVNVYYSSCCIVTTISGLSRAVYIYCSTQFTCYCSATSADGHNDITLSVKYEEGEHACNYKYWPLMCDFMEENGQARLVHSFIIQKLNWISAGWPWTAFSRALSPLFMNLLHHFQ